MVKPVSLIAACLLGLVAGRGAADAASARVADPAVPGCGDFLAQIGRKPAHAVYVGCRYQPDRQGKPLLARYRVEGRYAAAAEAYLVARVGLGRLKRICCYWGAAPRPYRDRKGRAFTITLASEETVIGTRAAWRRIPTFEIAVETFTEEI